MSDAILIERKVFARIPVAGVIEIFSETRRAYSPPGMALFLRCVSYKAIAPHICGTNFVCAFP